jgi:hypothetical protein
VARSTLSPAGGSQWQAGAGLTQLQQGDVVFLGGEVEVLVDQHFANSYFIPRKHCQVEVDKIFFGHLFQSIGKLGKALKKIPHTGDKASLDRCG